MSSIHDFVDVTLKLPDWIKRGLVDGTFVKEESSETVMARS